MAMAGSRRPASTPGGRSATAVTGPAVTGSPTGRRDQLFGVAVHVVHAEHIVSSPVEQCAGNAGPVTSLAMHPQLLVRDLLQPVQQFVEILFASVEAAGLLQHSIVRRFDTRADAVVADRLVLRRLLEPERVKTSVCPVHDNYRHAEQEGVDNMRWPL